MWKLSSESQFLSTCSRPDLNTFRAFPNSDKHRTHRIPIFVWNWILDPIEFAEQSCASVWLHFPGSESIERQLPKSRLSDPWGSTSLNCQPLQWRQELRRKAFIFHVCWMARWFGLVWKKSSIRIVSVWSRFALRLLNVKRSFRKVLDDDPFHTMDGWVKAPGAPTFQLA